MRIALIKPAASTPRGGNRQTARRYGAFLRVAGHRVRSSTSWDGSDCDLLIALHARKSHSSVARFRAQYPERPLVVVLTGTDLYGGIGTDALAQESLEFATLLVTLQELGRLELAPHLRPKVRVVFQSARAPRRRLKAQRRFRVCVIGHLREEKDPFRAARALALMPSAADVELVQLGQALSPGMAREARSRMRADRRYRWLGSAPHARALAWLASSHLLVVSSLVEGGANVVSEAIRARVPVLASRIRGNVGMLGSGYPGYFPPEDERALSRLIDCARADGGFYRRLERGVSARRALFAPAAERRGLLAVVREAMRLAGRRKRS